MSSGTISPSVVVNGNLENVLKTIQTMKVEPNTALIFDIDNTLIDELNRLIMPIFNIYKTAINRNIKIIIITSRPGTPINIRETTKQLKSHGISKFEAIYFLKPGKTDVPLMKFRARKNVFDKDFKVIYSFGDQDHDGYNCIYAGTFIKVTNVSSRYIM